VGNVEVDVASEEDFLRMSKRTRRPAGLLTRRAPGPPSTLYTFREISLRTVRNDLPAARLAAAPPAALFTFKETFSSLFLFLLLSLLLSPRLFAGPPHLDEVRAAMKAERWDDAVAAGERAVAESPDDAAAHSWLGRAYGQKAIHASLFAQMGWAKKCRTEFERAVALDPKSTDARIDLIQYYANAPGIAGGGKDKAREQIQALAALDPARAALMTGYVLEKEKKVPEAEAAYMRAVSLKPDDATIRWRTGRFLERAGKKDEAKASYREALRLDPSMDGPKKDLTRLGG
jgi:tetratricopeptide (TPR) repeat protein